MKDVTHRPFHVGLRLLIVESIPSVGKKSWAVVKEVDNRLVGVAAEAALRGVRQPETVLEGIEIIVT